MVVTLMKGNPTIADVPDSWMVSEQITILRIDQKLLFSRLQNATTPLPSPSLEERLSSL